MTEEEHFKALEDKIMLLSNTAWSDRNLHWNEVEKWLEQFDKEVKGSSIHFLHLLSNFMYFGRKEVREMLKSLYRDIYRCPIIQEIREANCHTKDIEFLNTEFEKVLQNTKFLGIGNPSESGTHLLYLFRQTNNIKKTQFINGHEVFKRDQKGETLIKDEKISRYVFIDDLAGSGSQAITYSKNLVKDIKDRNPIAKVSYYVLFATEEAIRNIQANSYFDEVRSIFTLDDSFKCFSARSRYFRGKKADEERENTKTLCSHFDRPLSKILCTKEGFPDENYYELGFNDSQLLLSFYHNTPDNAPPVFWFSNRPSELKNWKPIFNRYHKVY